MFIDPSGLTCQSANGLIYDDGDGKGCDALGIPPDGVSPVDPLGQPYYNPIASYTITAQAWLYIPDDFTDGLSITPFTPMSPLAGIPFIIAPNKPTPPPLTPQQQQQRKQNCQAGALAVGTGVIATVGVTIVTAIAWEDVVAVAVESAGEGFMTAGHLLTSLYAAPTTALAVGFNQMMLNWGKP